MEYRPWKWVNPPTDPQPGVAHKTYYSQAMGHDVGYSLYLPPDYERSSRRYPVVYWLHGLNNCESTDYFPAKYLTQGIEAGKLPPMILVYPNGWWCSFYSDSSDGAVLTETTIITELIPHIDRTYRTIPTREARAIKGMSMGGFGALKLAFKYVDMFSSVVAFAPALITAEIMETRHPELMDMAFGGDAERFEQQSPRTWAKQHAQIIRRTLPIWIICGAEDGLLPTNEAMDRLLDDLDIPHQLELIPGIAHSLPALAEAIQMRGFAFAARAFCLPAE